MSLFLVLLSGCTTFDTDKSSQDGGAWQSQEQRMLDERISSYLEGAGTGAVYQPDASPWGSGVMLTVEETYVAASGRPCRQLQVTTGQGERQVLACRANDTRWAEVRSLR
ncbi:DVU3141 family protein [Billgrantia lactosivorans]|uniref:DVU3141 family protein n=1 Tax=Billgrantia lactosivorans TaxID=2185141 RepID=UPI0013A6E574|nr:DVU3141 family protein [Halomonas lactosivorans]